jgi:uncharacterized protein YwqG
VRFVRQKFRAANREVPFFFGCFGLVFLTFLGAPVVALVQLFLGQFFAIAVALALIVLVVFVVYCVASGTAPSTARVYEVRARAFVAFEPVEDEGRYHAFDLGDERIVFVAGKEFDEAKDFPCLNFALTDLLDGRKTLGSMIECRGSKEQAVRTIPAQVTKTLAMPANLEVRSGNLETIEQDLKRPKDELVATYTYKRGQGMLRKADPEQWKRRLARMKVNGRAAFIWSRLAKPNVRLMTKGAVFEDETAPLTSKIGGLPDLPKGTAWPTYQFVPWQSRPREPGFFGRLLGRKAEAPRPPPAPETRPVPFLAQINLADIAKVGCDLPLPEAGLLLFFYEPHAHGFAASETTGARVLFVAEGTEKERPSAAPVSTAPVRALECESGETLPELEYLKEYVPAYSEHDFEDAYEALDDDVDTVIYAGNAFGGWPHSIQGTMELECELFADGMEGHSKDYDEAKARGLDKKAKEWRLLLQLTSEDTPELDWGDTGKVYVFCRKEDIAAGRFERCCILEQFH